MNSDDKFLSIHESALDWETWDGLDFPTMFWKNLIDAEKTDSGSMTLGILRVLPGESGTRHSHPLPEVYYILEGEGLVEIERKSRSLAPGTAVYIPGNMEHIVHNTGQSELRILYVFPADSFQKVRYHFPEDQT